MQVVCKGDITVPRDGETYTTGGLTQIIDPEPSNKSTDYSIECPYGSVVCGIQTKLVPYTSTGDNVGIVDVRLICCLLIVF